MPLDDRSDGPVRQPVRVAINHPLRSWVEALQRVLEPRPDITVVTGNTDVRWSHQQIASGNVDVLLVHVQPPATELFTLLHAFPRLRVVAISDSEDPALIARVIRHGGRGWVQPNASVVHLVRVLKGVAEGETWVPPRLLGPALDVLIESTAGQRQASELLAALSPRELEMLQCLVMGLTRREIAERYTLSPHTVRTHINNVLHKLDVHSTLAAVSIARRTGLVDSVAQQRRA